MSSSESNETINLLELFIGHNQFAHERWTQWKVNMDEMSSSWT